MSIRKIFKTDQNKCERGVWFDIGDTSFKLRYNGTANPLLDKTIEAVQKPYRVLIQKNQLDEKQARRINVEIFIVAVLIGWKGVPNADESGELPYSLDNARDLMLELPELYSTLREYAGDIANFRPETISTEGVPLTSLPVSDSKLIAETDSGN